MKYSPVEGGHFRQTYRAGETVLVAAPEQGKPRQKPRSTAIIYLLSRMRIPFRRWHTLPTDEIYHFYLGDPVELLLLKQDGSSEVITLGHDILNGTMYPVCRPRRGVAGLTPHPGGEFAVLGTTMAPGYVDGDYIPGDRELLVEQYPDRAELITSLTR